MKHYGLTIAEGTEITNATVATGTSFPGNESSGELFFRTDTSALYVWDGSEWDKASTTEVVDDTTPALGGDLDVGGFDIEASSGGANLRLNDTTTYLQGKYVTDGVGTNLTLVSGGSNLVGGGLNLWAGDADAVGGTVNMTAGDGGTSNAGDIQINGGASTDGIGGEVKIKSGNSTNGTSGDIQFIIGTGSTEGSLVVQNVGASGAVVPLKFQESGVTNDYVALQAPTAVATSRTWTLPQSDPATSTGKFLTTNAAGEWSFDTVATSPAGDTTQIQYNNGGVLAADDDLTWISGGRFLYVGNTGTGYITSGNGNKLSIRAASSATTTGGILELKAGTGASTSNGGSMTLTAGKGGSTSGNGGSLILNSGSASEGDGGVLQVNAGDGVGTNQRGGAVNITGGASTGTQIGGNVGIIAGAGGDTGEGGAVQIIGGSGGATSGVAGNVVITGAESVTAAHNGGQVQIAGGENSSTGAGGWVTIDGGASASGSTGGIINITGGEATTGTVGGTVNIKGGLALATGGQGSGQLYLEGGSTLTIDDVNGGDVFLRGGNAKSTSTSGNGGDVYIRPGFGGNSTGDIIIDNILYADVPTNLKFASGDSGSIFVTLVAPQTVTTSRTWVLPQDDPSTASGKFLTTDASGILSFAAAGGGSPGGSDRQVQFNDSSSFGGDSGLVYESDGTLNVAGTADYEDLVTSDDDIPNKKYVDDEIAAAPVGTYTMNMQTYEYLATAGQTTFSGSDQNGQTLSYAPGKLLAFQNGAMLDPSDYTATTGTSVVLDTAASLDDEVNFVAFAEETSTAAQPLLYEYTATADQTTFSGADDNSVVLSYTAGELLVFKNGSLLDPSDFTATSGTSMVLDVGATAGDEVNILRFIAVERFNTLKTYRYILDDGDDTISGTDAKGNTLGYAVGLFNLFLNGSKVSEDEYTATDGSSIVLDTAVVGNNHIVEVTTFSTFTSVDEVVPSENIIINGNFNIWQRGTTFTRDGAGSGTFTADRWRAMAYGAMTLGIDRDGSDRPNGSDYSLAMNVDVVDTSIGAADWVYMRYVVEGFDLQSTKISTADATVATLSFKVKSPVTGTHCVSFRNGPFDRYYIAEYTIDTADTWETKTITLPLDTTGTWYLGSGVGMYITWALAVGTDNHGTADSWQAGTKTATSNQVNVVGTINDKFKLSQVRFEIGSRASSFRDRLIKEEFALCQRYYQRVVGGASFPSLPGQSFNSTLGGLYWEFPTEMRAAPTIGNNLTASSGTMTATGGLAPFSSMSTINSNTARAFLRINTTGGLVAGNASSGLFTSGEYIDADAEI